MEQRQSHTSGPRIVNPYVETSNTKAGRFLTLSVFVHAAMLATVSLMSLPPVEISKPDDIIEIEMMSEAGSDSFEDSLPAVGSAGPLGASPAEDTTATVAPVAAPTTTPETSSPPTSAPVAKIPQAPKSSAPAVPAKTIVAQESTQASEVKATLDDIQAPDLETTPTGEVPVSQLDEKDLQEDFEKIDQSHQHSLDTAKKELEEQTASAAAANEAALMEAKKNAEAEQAEILAAAEARRQKDAEILAAAKAKELAMIAARDARLQERTQAEARARAQAAAAATAAAATAEANQKGNGGGDGEEGSVDSGGEGTKQVSGIPGGVRSLGQLRQKPGNRFPPYAPRERLLRQEGTVVYYAYVNKDGTLSEFKLSKSTGYKNLDEKTLIALRSWKFYPGQEGWVEMPFQWSLKGEAQEAGGLLR